MGTSYKLDFNTSSGNKLKLSPSFRDLFFQWKGSIFKLVWPDLTVFLTLYLILSVLYRFVLTPEHQRVFEKIATYCEKYGTVIPVSFVLGFYVSLVVGRWWAQYKLIPWIDSLAIWVNSTIRGDNEEERLLRRTICRYACLSITQCFTLISAKTKRRFPTLDHLVVAGLLLENEKEKMEEIVGILPKYQTHWIPLVWASTLVSQARIEGKIVSDTWMRTIMDELKGIKDQCNMLLCFDRIKVPLVYTQVVTFAVYSYFLSCLMGRQWVRPVDPESQKPKISQLGVEDLDLVIPTFTILQFLFYVGWLKVAESLANPFGDEDYDFELNWIVDRHLQVAYTIVDKMHFGQSPAIEKDPYWDVMVPAELPHTLASLKHHVEPPKSSTATLEVPKDECDIVSPSDFEALGTTLKANILWKRKTRKSKWKLGGTTSKLTEV